VYIDSVVKKISDSNIACYMKYFCMSILLYADDILLIAPSVTSLQQLMHLCEQELARLDMPLNVKKLEMWANAQRDGRPAEHS